MIITLLLFLITLVYIFFADIKEKVIYDYSLYILIFILIINHYAYDQPINIASGLMVFIINYGIYVFYKLRYNKEYIGTGDIKLASILAFFIDSVYLVPVFIFTSGVFGFLSFFVLKGENRIPFAPAIILAFLLSQVIWIFNLHSYLY